MHDFPIPPHQAIVCQASPLKALNILIGGIVKIPHKVENSYEKLVCTAEDTACVQKIVITMAENGKIALLFKQRYLRELGSKIGHLHPFKFMTSIFCYSHLMPYMTEIFNDYFKKTGFMDGLASSLSLEAEKGTLAKYLPKFAEEIQVPLERMQPYFDRNNWYDLVEMLIAYKTQK